MRVKNYIDFGLGLLAICLSALVFLAGIAALIPEIGYAFSAWSKDHNKEIAFFCACCLGTFVLLMGTDLLRSGLDFKKRGRVKVG